MALSGQMVNVQDALRTRCRIGAHGHRSRRRAMKRRGVEQVQSVGARSDPPIPNQIL